MSKSRRRSQQKEKSQKRSAFEKFDQIRYSCYQIDENIQQLGSTMDMIHFEPAQESVQIPTELFEKMLKFTEGIQKDFKTVQSDWSNFFDEQQEATSKYRGKSKNYKKKLSELENQSMVYMKDQKEFEKSLVDITKEHDMNKDKMGLVLDQMESQVSELKNTRQCLNLKYESQLDKAVKEMINFYNNLEGDENEFDQDNIDRVFFIKPDLEVDLRLNTKSSSETGLKIQNQAISSGPEEFPKPKPKTPQQKTTIPRIPMEKLNQKIISPKIKKESPKIVDLKPENEIEDYVTNPVMMGAMHQTSKFEQKYEDDFEGANITLDMQTSRLAQFPEEYEMLCHIEDPDQRIIMKQMVFFKYEKLLKKQTKVERKRQRKIKKQQLLELEQQKEKNSGEKVQVVQSNRSLIPTPTNMSSFTKFGQQKSKFGNLSSKSSQKTQKQMTKTNGLNLGKQQVNDANEYTGMGVTSRFSMQSELPSIDTIECFSAQKKFRGQDVNHSEIINCEEILVDGLKSATQKSLIKKIEEEFRQKEIVREQQKGDEKKLNYSSSTQSKISLLGKQISQGSLNSKVGINMLSDQMLAKQYGSNSHSNSNPKLIVVDSEYSMNSNIQKHSKKRLDSLNVEIILDGYDQQNLPSGIHFGQEFDPSNLSLITPSDVQKKVQDTDKVDESFLSANSQYQRFFDQNQESESKQLSGGYPSPQLVQNSYIQSSNQSAENVDKIQHNYEEPQQLPDQVDDDSQNNRKRLPLDVIQERQSEFSQSMMTNVARLNSHRSKQNAQYHNQSKVNQSGLPSGRSDVNNKSSSRKKNERPPICDMEDYKNFNIRAGSQAQTSRNGEQQRHNNSVEQAFAKNSRNSFQKISKSSKDVQELQNFALKKQPSAGKIENQNRQRYLQNFESDMNEIQFNVQKCAPPVPIATKSKSFKKQNNNYVNLTTQNSQLNSERELQYQPHSQRSHIAGESLRDRSYFDESPAIFENLDSGNSAKRDTSDRYLVTNMYADSSQNGTGILQMQTIPQSQLSSAVRQEEVKEEKPLKLLIRSNSECQLRDKEFYEMCDEEDEINIFCKFAEQNFLENMHVRNLSAQYNHKNNVTHLHNQSSDGQTQFFPSNANKSNQLVFLSQQTFNRLNGLQSRGKATIQKLSYDPTRLLASINNNNGGIQANGPQVSYTGTNLLTNSLDAATTLLMHNQLMNPTHQYNRRTLLMMQNLHNNYLYSHNSGILFTMQRGWNSGGQGNGASTNPQIGIGHVFKNLTGVEKNSSIGVKEVNNSLGGDPVNISNLLNGAKQEASDAINVGCVTIVDDDGKFLMDRKMLLEANNSSHQTNARRLFSMSRNIYGQVTTSDFSNLQTKQLGILRNNLRPPAVQNANASSRNFKNFDNVGISKNSEQLYEVDLVEPSSEKNDQKKKTDQNKIMNLITGLKKLQNRPGSDLSTEQQNAKKIPAKWSQDQGPRMQSAQGEIESQTSQGNLTTVKSQAKKGITPNGLQNLKNMIKIQQKQNQMNLSQSIQLNNDSLLQKQHVLSGNFKTVISQKNIMKLKSKSQPKNNVEMTQKEDIIQKNKELIEEIRKLQGYKSGVSHTQNSSDVSSISKQNKVVKLVSNTKSSQNFNTIQNQNNSEMTLKIQQSQSLRQQNYTTVQTYQKPLKDNFFQAKKNSYQGIPQKSARTSQPSGIFIGQNGKLSIKKKVLNQQISMPNSLV